MKTVFVTMTYSYRTDPYGPLRSDNLMWECTVKNRGEAVNQLYNTNLKQQLNDKYGEINWFFREFHVTGDEKPYDEFWT